MSPTTITDTLAISPTTPFPSRHDYQTFWVHHFKLRDDGDLPKFIAGMIEDLRQHRAFFRSIRDSGGMVGLIVDVIEHGPELQMTLPHDLLHAFGDLGIHMSFALYGLKVEESPAA